MLLDVLADLNNQRTNRRASLLVTNLASGEQRHVRDRDLANDPLSALLGERLRMGKSGTVSHEGQSFFITVQEPAVRLVVIGAVHISQTLTALAKVVGLDITIVDPRTAFASPERFPDTNLITDWPDDALPSLGLDRFTALAALTHDPKIDDPALAAGLASDCFYIGALGSRRSHAGRLERLKARGFPESVLDRIQAPIGLDIGAVSPAEIAVSILGEVILALRHKPTRAETSLTGQPT